MKPIQPEPIPGKRPRHIVARIVEPELAHDSPEFLHKLRLDHEERVRTNGPVETWPSIVGAQVEKPQKIEPKNQTKSLFGD